MVRKAQSHMELPALLECTSGFRDGLSLDYKSTVVAVYLFITPDGPSVI